MSDVIGYVIKSTKARRPIKSFYPQLWCARMIATRFNNDSYNAGDYEVFEVTGLKKVEK